MPYEEWMDRSSCADMTVDPDIFFSTDLTDIETAKNLCAGCPVAMQCLDYAIRGDEREGLWAGRTGRQIARKSA